ncbi:DUF2637 domain-containing protein [Streptomyces sp. NPDC088846]|uniref:DUF2637 domain-containing protein n=1 Tax=Streptomyces sp. NPDC088846 TaxID=3365908 RepID=UPI0038204370
MTTTIEPPITAPAPVVRPASGTRPTPSATPVDASPAQQTEARRVSRKTKISLIAFGITGSVLIGVIGFLLSFDNLTAAGVRWGFGDRASWFAVGVDVSILTFLVVDLILVIFDVRFGLPRFLAHLMTGATVFFNATAHGSPFEHPVRSVAHGLMPVFFVAGIEAGRRLLIKQAALERGREHDPIPLNRWALAPIATTRLFRRMKLWEIRSYTTAVDLERNRAIYEVWLKHREELESGKEDDQVGELDRLPMTMKKFGMSVEEALALPDKMRRDEQERKQKAAAAELHLTLAAEKSDAEAETERLRIQGEIDRVRASVKADTGVAEAEADAAEATARLQATTALQAAERAATAAERQAAAEADAEQSVKVAEAKAKEKAERAKLAEESAKETAELAKKKASEALVAEADAKKSAAEAKTAEESAKVAEADRRVAEAEAEAAEARERTARANLAAAEAEDLAGFSQRQRRVRLVARMLLDSVPAEQTTGKFPSELADLIKANSPVTNAQIAEAIGVKSEGTASEHAKEAIDLISRGYNHHSHSAYDPDRATTQQ